MRSSVGTWQRFALAALAAAVLAVAVAAPAQAFSPTGPQPLLVVPMEHAHSSSPCPADSTGMPTCPRYTAAQWQTILQRELNRWYGTESYGRTSWQVRVLADPNTANGWWPAPHTGAQYGAMGNNNFWSQIAIVRDAAEPILSQAIQQGAISAPDAFGYHRFLVIDNYHRRGGQTNDQGAPVTYYPTAFHILNINIRLPFITTAAVVAEDSDDTDALSVIEHELGHQLGEPDLYSQSPCPLMEPGAVSIPAANDDNHDCVGPWDHMGLDYQGFPGLGVYTRVKNQWINAVLPSVRTQLSGFSGNVNISPVEAPNGDPVALHIPNDPGRLVLARIFGGYDYFQGFLVECRRHLGNDGGTPAEGLVVSYLDTTRGDHPQFVVRRSASTDAFTAALSNPGDEYNNTTVHLRVRYDGLAPNGSCMASVNRTRTAFGHLAAAIPWGIRLADVAGFGQLSSHSVFAGDGITLNGPKKRKAFVAAAARSTRVSPVAHRHPARVRFSFGNSGDAPVDGTATVSVTDPYQAFAACGGPEPDGRAIGKFKIRGLKPGKTATRQLKWRPRSNGPYGVTARFDTSGGGALAPSEIERTVVGFQTHRRRGGKKKTPRAVTSTIFVKASKSCPGPISVAVEPLLLARGWVVTSSGLAKPLKPGERRRVKIKVQGPKGAPSSALDIPLTIEEASATPAREGTPAPPYLHTHPSFIGGLDMLARVAIPHHTIPSFAIPSAVRTAPPTVSYPPAPGAPGQSSLSIKCPNNGPLPSDVTTTGSLAPAETGAKVRLRYTPPQGDPFDRTVSTNVNGNYSDTITADQPGTWTVQSFFNGDADHQKAASGVCQFGIG